VNVRLLATFLLVLPAVCPAALPDYVRHQLSGAFLCEGSTFADLNNDGHTDAIAGPYWYAGPGFKDRHALYPVRLFDPLAYSDNFFAFPYDFNRDGWMDVLVLGFPGQKAIWYENPGTAGKDATWTSHVVFEGVDNESPAFGDLLGTGQPVLICNHAKTFGYATFDPDNPAAPWIYHAVSPAGGWGKFHHGLGWGDINGDGRADILENSGWREQPADLAGDPVWRHHAVEFSQAAAQMLVTDANGDGLADVITAIHAHGYGLSWFEQARTDDGVITFREHVLLPRDGTPRPDGVQFSQLHALALADLDRDGLDDIVTGKRWWAHGNHGDPEPNGSPVLYAFLLRRGADGSAAYVPHRIDDASGVGVQLVAADANADGIPDLITANKRGTFVFLSRAAPEIVTVPLWPGTAPGETQSYPPESDTTGPDGRRVAGRPVVRLGNVSRPAFTVHRPPSGTANGAAVIVCPGGGYSILAMDIEGTEVCDWLNANGVTAILLKYRVPRREDVPHRQPPLQDLQRALGLVRQRAADWGIDPARIGVLGFSAGGSLAARASNTFTSRTYPPVDEADTLSCRPDFALLIYPADLVAVEDRTVLAPDLRVGARTPPTFLVMTGDDPLGIEHALAYYVALDAAGVKAELHMYPTGGHGYGLRRTENPLTAWPARAAEWLRAGGWLETGPGSSVPGVAAPVPPRAQ
jgi:acetyl esterase/lipase